MKIKIIAAFTVLIFTLFSCIPERADMKPKEVKLIADKYESSIGESVELSFLNLFNPENRYVQWTVVPDNGVVLDSVFSRTGNSIKFNLPGTYTIKADVRSVSPYCMPLSGQDSCFNASAQKIPLQIMVTIKN